jgi:hypothetical protein
MATSAQQSSSFLHDPVIRPPSGTGISICRAPETHAIEYASLYADRSVRTLESGPRWTMTHDEVLAAIQSYRPQGTAQADTEL